MVETTPQHRTEGSRRVDGRAPTAERRHEGPLLCDHLLVGLTGSPAVLAMPQQLLLLRQGLVGDLRVMMSRGAQRFLPAYTVRLFAGSWVHTDTHAVHDGYLVPHIELAQAADLLLVMPATANVLAKAAQGICDDLISTAIVACTAPVVLVPAMNETMWASRAVRRNVERARELGYHVIDPGEGLALSDLAPSTGLMPPLEHIVSDLIAIVDAARGAAASR
jgi:phosphopantothenoylcysteine synthetase/decarboxylase